MNVDSAEIWASCQSALTVEHLLRIRWGYCITVYIPMKVFYIVLVMLHLLKYIYYILSARFNLTEKYKTVRNCNVSPISEINTAICQTIVNIHVMAFSNVNLYMFVFIWPKFQTSDHMPCVCYALTEIWSPQMCFWMRTTSQFWWTWALWIVPGLR